jgi:hypothetical protein
LKKSARECGSSIGRDIKEGSATTACLIWIISAMPAKMQNASLLRKKDVIREIEKVQLDRLKVIDDEFLISCRFRS